MIKACPESLRWIVYEIIAILGFYGNVLWGTLWHHIRRWKPFFQTHHTYMCDTSLEASFQALFKTGFRLKIFPLEVGFFRSRNVHVWGTCLPKIFDATYFQKNWPLQPLNKHNTYSIWYQSNSYFKLYPELFSNWKYSYNRYLFWFFWKYELDASRCTDLSDLSQIEL